MDTKNLNNKSKIFVRYPPGASGHFISCLILSLVKYIRIYETHRCHRNINDINQGHDFRTQWTDKFKNYTNTAIDLDASVKWIKNNFRFYPTDDKLYVVHTHVINPSPLMLAFDNTKLVNICITDNDLDQICFNWVTKSVYLYPEQWKLINNMLTRVQTKHQKLKNIPHNSIDISTDLKLVTYIQKYSKVNNEHFNKPVISDSYDVYNINFSDIANKNLIGQLDELIEFLDIEVSAERKAAAIQMINEYADAQTVVPWKLNLEDYD